MATRIALHHQTTYHYDRAVTMSPHVIRLRPAPHARTKIISYSMRIEPENHFHNLNQDPFGNFESRLVFLEPADKLDVVIDLVAELTAFNPFDYFLEEEATAFPFTYRDEVRKGLKQYLEPSEEGEQLEALVAKLKPKEPLPTNDFIVGVNQELERLIGYQIRMEPGVQSCAETLEKGSGSCRDSAYLLVQLLRHLGLAARFVSGYLVQLVPDEKPLEGPEGPTEDFTDLHAWAEVFLPGAGWVGLDPTSGLFAGEGHIPLAATPEPSDAAPITGGTDSCEVTFSFANSIQRIHEDPRVTKPYTETEWETIVALGHAVDQRLDAAGVQLTMGGEPTFVSVDDQDGEEWNYTADSPAKRALAMELLGRMREAFAPGALRWYGEGKWYPGEPVPRWAYGCFWRKDGVPLWRDQALLGDPSQPGETGSEMAQTFADGVARALGIAPGSLLPALEDEAYYRWKASALPTDESVDDAGESDSLERRTLAELHRRGLEVPSGYVLPLYFEEKDGAWHGGKWTFRRDHLYLIPGASALGYRLPIDSLTEVKPHDVLPEACPLQDYPPLPAAPAANPPETAPEDTDWMPRTALCFEVRDRRLHVFFPPAGLLERYLTLLHAVESVATELGTAVVIEGYEPPADPRLGQFRVTPDPGVIEVNIHPSRTWPELVERTTTLYELARQSKLGAEKFMLDGRHNGTGGGNHVVIGAERPADSPFLQRPGLLRSLITYWQHHPGLSYLFSGLFIGPTSQAPRIDEVQEDRLFELDIAFSQLPETSETPWLVDRVLRNLLTDGMGNTHRAEFCIDKLYSPDSASGRLGLLELRAFEMPPHARMSLVQALLVRSLIAKFRETPYRHKLVRWGTSLHDQFLLPHFTWQDIRDVGADLKASGIGFEAEWLRPFHEFRFPVYGRVQYEGVEIELRGALEPWHVLGEERSTSGMARYVDSSLERLQVRVRGFVEGRHLIVCNGRRLPLFPTGTSGEYVSGVRYKAWNPWSALHPTIEVQTPLRFDLIDERNRRSLGGCIYHVSHPGGRSYEVFPVNALEAGARRGNRFWDHGHTAGAVETRAVDLAAVSGRFMEPFSSHEGTTAVPPEEPIPEFPLTLDLRCTPEHLSSGVRPLHA